MKKFLKYILISAIFVIIPFLTACDFGGSTDEPAIPKPTEIAVSGFSQEITVGESIYSKLKVQQKISEEWKEVPKADYVVSCDYDATSYGTYDFVVSLKEYPKIVFSTQITVNPIEMEVPTYSTTYNGNIIDIKSKLDELSYIGTEKVFDVISYANRSDVGSYTAKVRLIDANKYVWSRDGVTLSGKTQTVGWEITKAGESDIFNKTQVTAFYGDTLLEVIQSNQLNYINGNQIDFQFIDENGNNLSHDTVITDQATLYAKFRPNSNYEYNTQIVLSVTITINAGYKVEHYKYGGSEYILSDTDNLSAKITSLVTATPKDYDGFAVNDNLSIKVGRVTKNGELVLKIYYDAV